MKNASGSRELLSSRICLGYDLGYRGPVETLEPLVPLQVFHVAAYGSLSQKLLELLSRYVLLRQQPLEPSPFHRPDLSNRKRLFQELKVRERGHEANALHLQVLRQSLEIEPSLKVMHSRLQHALSVQSYPKANSAEHPLSVTEASVRKVNPRLIRLEVYVGEYDDVADW